MEGLHYDTILDDPTPDFSDKTDNLVSKEVSTTKEGKTSSGKDFSQSDINKNLDKETKLGLYEQMVRIRRFEERSLRSYQQVHIGGFLHLYIGQEAVSVGMEAAIRPNDAVITGYRCHAHMVSRGASPYKILCELY